MSDWLLMQTEELGIISKFTGEAFLPTRVTTFQTMWNSLTIPWRFAALLRGTRRVKCYSYHAHTSVTVSGGVGMQQYMIQNHIFNI